MKSTNNKRRFTLEDFEEGLMLAGFITPSSSVELQNREALDDYEKTLSQERKRVFFKRIVLAAEVASQLHNEPTLGRVKFQKLVYLCENAAGMELNDRYAKQVAGPFDHKFMHSVEDQFKRNNWFIVEKVKDGQITRSVYKPLPEMDKYKKYYNSYFKNTHEDIQYVIDLFRNEKTDITEIAATLYACAIELNKDKLPIEKTNLLERFYKWSKMKSRFKKEVVLEIWEWMNEKHIRPIF